VRKQAMATGVWPPSPAPGDPAYNTTAQENKILLAAAFSPLK